MIETRRVYAELVSDVERDDMKTRVLSDMQRNIKLRHISIECRSQEGDIS